MQTNSIQNQNSVYSNNYQTLSTSTTRSQIHKESLSIDYKTKDGDTLSLNYQKVTLSTYNRNGTLNNAGTTTKNNAVLTPEEAEKLRTQLKTEMFSYKEALVKSFVEANGGTYQSVSETDVENDPEVEALEAKMPEYWNAENTSQRIVDFATSFLSSYQGENSSDFFKTIKDAIETGFKQAKEMLGNLPGSVGKLAEKTYALTMKKLDAFEQQIANQNQNTTAESAAA